MYVHDFIHARAHTCVRVCVCAYVSVAELFLVR